MNWRAWIYSALADDAGVTAEVPAGRIYQGGTLTSRPEEAPFLVITFLPSAPAGRGRAFERVQVWAHDRAASYVRIDRILRAVQDALEGQAAEEKFVAATWEGDGADTADDAMDTRTRYAMFRLAARRDQ